MIKKIVLKNYKCFENLELELKQLSVLCGINSGGKSSVIQGILLAAEALEAGTQEISIDLMNSKYHMDLYTFEEILYDDTDEEEIEIKLYEDNQIRKIALSSLEGDNNIHCMNKSDSGIRKSKMWYLNAERTISKVQKRGNAEDLTLGENNEYLGYLLERGRSNKIAVDKGRNCIDKDNVLFATQVNEWLDRILPGNFVMASSLGNDNLVSLQFGKEHRLHRSNVGFGVGFVLPIIVSGLLAKEGDCMIVENPELHLHPKAQSDLALFLSVISKAGVQVIIETHSDHIVNGVRKAVVNPENAIDAQDVAIDFFGKERDVTHITMDQDAQLSDWPTDFMEQMDVDLYYMRKMRMKNADNITD